MGPETNKTFNDFYEDFTRTGRPEDPALHYNETTVTRSEFVSGVDAMRKRLSSLGVGIGSNVGYTLPNCPEAFYLFLALSNLGACAIPLFPMIPDQVRDGLSPLHRRHTQLLRDPLRGRTAHLLPRGFSSSFHAARHTLEG
jgi:acyl-coenzyme A synthetase/AMP-(fatty) acid ligase